MRFLTFFILGVNFFYIYDGSSLSPSENSFILSAPLPSSLSS